MEDSLQGRHFSIMDSKEVNTVIYKINETEKEYLNESPKYTLERLDYIEELIGDNNKKKTFLIEDKKRQGEKIVILSFGKEKVVVNVGELDEDKVKISKMPIPMKFETLYNEKETEYKDFTFTPNLKRPISIIDPITTEEIKPILFFDEETNEVKGKCKLKPYKSYFAFELRENNKDED